MPTKEERQAEAKKHLGLMKAVFAKETAASAQAATIYEDGEGRELAIPDAHFENTATPVSTDFSVTALFKREGATAVVDPAAFRTKSRNQPFAGMRFAAWPVLTVFNGKVTHDELHDF